MKRKNNISLRIKGQLKRTVRNALTGVIIPKYYDKVDNLIVTNGYALLARVLVGDAVIGYNGVGSGTTPAALTDSDLETPILPRQPITHVSVAGKIALVSTFFSAADNNDYWAESCLATEQSGDDTIICRALYTNPFTKTNQETVTNDWTLEFIQQS
jgi:hypothetical protein